MMLNSHWTEVEAATPAERAAVGYSSEARMDGMGCEGAVCGCRRYCYVILCVARYVVSVRADIWLGAAAMPASEPLL